MPWPVEHGGCRPQYVGSSACAQVGCICKYLNMLVSTGAHMYASPSAGVRGMVINIHFGCDCLKVGACGADDTTFSLTFIVLERITPIAMYSNCLPLGACFDILEIPDVFGCTQAGFMVAPHLRKALSFCSNLELAHQHHPARLHNLKQQASVI